MLPAARPRVLLIFLDFGHGEGYRSGTNGGAACRTERIRRSGAGSGRRLRVFLVYYDMHCANILLLLSLSALSAGAVPASVLGAATDLLDASHMLHFLGVVDAFGHVSVRSPANASEFLLSAAVAPAQATAADIVTYDIANATARQVTLNASAAIPAGFAERFIHSEIYKRFPDAHAVVHAHTPAVLPFANQPTIALVAQMHTAPALGPGAPVFDTRALPPAVLPPDAPHDLLVRTAALGAALAGAFRADSRVVLMRGHGMALRAGTLRQAVFDAYYVAEDAAVQLQAALLGMGHAAPIGLDAREVADASDTVPTLVGRAWALWAAQVDGAALYVNDLRRHAPPAPTGF
ncbi:Arad-like aldolase/epimerase [Mycena indigotica]|uniref:Arad-like aldolase/epimerase n=1 Tax=Mycena indigotica TaxID=2126181 RepID=A0A8H6WD10_9AGAR|nr:Arad-like aldolase/epimerase [Mycena indigotica]KAF7312001.1 Arad-like aldolase/epimerase [Mycena indigotica]